MYYNNFKNLKLSALGFGTMRLPCKEDGSIDVAETEKMMDYALKNGVNYIDTANPYHNGMSEPVIGEILSKYPRDSFYLATKYPGHQHVAVFNPKEKFESQLERCKVDYFDFYLLHNVTELSIDDYLDERWNIIPYFIEQRKLGKIKHLGFSSHAKPETLERFLKLYGKEMEFCQIQLNFLDWTLQEAKKKYELLSSYNIPVWVMEPVRGGRLVKEVTPSLAFRWLQSLPNVTMILSGMSNFEQMKDNVNTFSDRKPLTEEENKKLQEIANKLKSQIPCTGCRYCCDGCPQGLDIPFLLTTLNDISISNSFTPIMAIEGLPENKKPSACISCKKCTKICPQGIDVPSFMKKLDNEIKSRKTWKEVCKEREEAQKRNG